MQGSLGVGTVVIEDKAVLAAFGCALPNALVVNVDHGVSEVTAIIDGEVVLGGQEAVPVVIQGDTATANAEIFMNLFERQHNHAVPTVLDAIFTVLKRCDMEKRPILLDHIILTGDVTKNPNLRVAFEHSLKQALPASEFHGEYQVKAFKIRSVPDYYSEVWQMATPVAAWFGGGITAKCIFSDPKNL